MNHCPKCGSYDISGPKYVSASAGDGWWHKHSEERLRYTCNRCGYSETTPTDDAAKGASDAK